MKRFLSTITLAAFTCAFALAQNAVPSTKVKNLEGKTFDTSEFENEGKPMIINFWATWCTPCKQELNTIAEEYEEWVDETGVKLIAISIDDARTSSRVKPYVNAKGWEYDVYIDENSDFRRAMNVQNPPYTFLVNGKGEIVYTHTGYSPGDEEELFEKLKELSEH